MALTYFDPDKITFDWANFLIHGGLGKGKTHLAGDMLRTEKQHGKVLFVNMTGQDGYTTLKGMGLGADTVASADTYDDLRALRSKLKKEPLQALAMDGLKDIIRMIRLWVTGGEDRDLRAGDYRTNEWSSFNREVDSFFTSLRRGTVAKYVMVLSPSDRGMAYIETGKRSPMITPDAMSSRFSEGIGFFFDYVFFLEATVGAPMQAGGTPVVTRKIITQDPEALTRTRLAKPLPAGITIPEGKGGWLAIRKAIEKSLANGEEAKA